jgi:hypothetical protein
MIVPFRLGGCVGRKLDHGIPSRRGFPKLIYDKNLEIDQVGTILDPFVDNLGPTPGDIAEDVWTAQGHIEFFQETVIAHPIGHQLTKPRNPLRADVVSPRHTNVARHFRLSMSACRAVLGAGFGIDKGVRWMALGGFFLPQNSCDDTAFLKFSDLAAG